jgi:Tol biopolymer transport system component
VLRLLLPILVLGLALGATGPGAARPDVKVNGDIDWISWAPGSTILFDAFSGSYSVRPDGSGLRRIDGQHPVWAPDASRIAVDVGDFPGSIVVMNGDGSGAHRIRKGGMYPVWSPSGDRIAATTTRRILTMNADGTAVRKVAALRWGQDFWRELDWSPDGSRVVFSRCLRFVPEGDLCSGDRREGTFTASADRTLGPTRKIATAAGCPDWAPGRRMAVAGRRAVSIVAPDGSRAHVAVSRPRGCGAWSPDGRLVAVETSGALILAKADGSERWRLHKLPPPPFNLSSPVAPAPAWSPDGKWIAVACTVGNPTRGTSSRIYVIRVRDGRARVIVRTPFAG